MLLFPCCSDSWLVMAKGRVETTSDCPRDQTVTFLAVCSCYRSCCLTLCTQHHQIFESSRSGADPV